MKNKLTYLFALILLGSASGVFAHLPRIIDSSAVSIEDPEVSQAFYAELKGEPAVYEINSNHDFNLYVNILVPKSTNPNGRYSFNIFRVIDGKEEAIVSVDGTSSNWPEFYEEFGGDYYFKGPEFEKIVKAGEYRIFVYGNGNYGKYVLAVGQQEKFTLTETFKTIWVLPELKINFFRTSVFKLFTTPLKWIFILPIIILLALIVLAVFLIRKKGRNDKTVLA